MESDKKSNRVSKGHARVGELLSACNFKYVEEYPVSKVNPNSRLRGWYDWAILDLHCVIEVHGEQHYHAVDFSGKDAEGSVMKLHEQRLQDTAKERAATEAGWAYVAISYTILDDLDVGTLFYQIRIAIEQASSIPTEKKPESEYDKERKERARIWRKEQYQRQKKIQQEWKEKYGD